MTWSLATILALTLIGCSQDTSKHILIAPSAEGEMYAIATAVERLNEAVGYEAWTLAATSSEDRVDGQVVLSLADALPNGTDGVTTRYRRGITVAIMPGTHPAVIAHELCHAAGLRHVEDDPLNLMYPKVSAWNLTEEQLDELR